MDTGYHVGSTTCGITVSLCRSPCMLTHAGERYNTAFTRGSIPRASVWDLPRYYAFYSRHGGFGFNPIRVRMRTFATGAHSCWQPLLPAGYKTDINALTSAIQIRKSLD